MGAHKKVLHSLTHNRCGSWLGERRKKSNQPGEFLAPDLWLLLGSLHKSHPKIFVALLSPDPGRKKVTHAGSKCERSPRRGNRTPAQRSNLWPLPAFYCSVSVRFFGRRKHIDFFRFPRQGNCNTEEALRHRRRGMISHAQSSFNRRRFVMGKTVSNRSTFRSYLTRAFSLFYMCLSVLLLPVRLSVHDWIRKEERKKARLKELKIPPFFLLLLASFSISLLSWWGCHACCALYTERREKICTL